MRVDFLKAGNGDCILMQGNGHNVLIDSGECCEELHSVINRIIESEEMIDLLVITHYDSDHIKTIVNILRNLTPEERRKLIGCVWFNATKVGFKGNELELSANDAVELGHLLIEADITWVSELKKGTTKEISNECRLEVIDGGAIFNNDSKGGLLSSKKSDWGVSFKELERYLDDDAQDSSPTNALSAIIVAHVNGKKILLPGDAVPCKLSEALDNYRHNEIAKFDLIKLPHHGSYKNITKDILSKIECSEYVITTDGSQFYHPNKKMMLKVIKWGRKGEGKDFTFHLNYFDELINKMNIHESDFKTYRFSCDGKRTFEF